VATNLGGDVHIILARGANQHEPAEMASLIVSVFSSFLVIPAIKIIDGHLGRICVDLNVLCIE